MYSAFHDGPADAQDESLQRGAQRARLVYEAPAHQHPAAGGPKKVLLAASLALAAATGLVACASSQPAHHGRARANHASLKADYGRPAADGGYSCLRDTGGGGGQCNATEGLPQVRSQHRSGGRHTPNECILANGGDYNACNVGNSGRGDLPYRPVSPHR